MRVDSGVIEGNAVGVNYDPLIAKLIAQAETRDAALARAAAALRSFPILGIRTNIPYLIRLLEHPDVRRGAVHTGFIGEQQASLAAPLAPSLEAVAAAVVAHRRTDSNGRSAMSISTDDGVASDPWTTLRGWGR